MKSIATNSTTYSTTKFGTLNLIDKGLLLIKKNKEEHVILFSELNKIYIKKCKFSFLKKIGLLSLFLILIATFSNYLPIEIVLLASILLIPLFAKINTYKKYQLNILLKDGTFFIKNFNQDTKQEYIKMVNLVRKEIFDNHIIFNIPKEIPSTEKKISEDYAFPSLSIA